MIRFPEFRKVILFAMFIITAQNIISQTNKLISVKAVPNRNFAIAAPSDYFIARFADCTYKINSNGQVTKYFLNTSDSVAFKLDLNKGSVIAYAEVNHFGNSLIICYTEDDGETGGSYVSKFDLQTLKKIWTYPKISPNLSRLKINNNFIYITSFCVVAKLDLSTGNEVFRLDDLYDREKYAFNSFSDIIFNGDTVSFVSKNWHSNRLDKVVINDRTNTLITIDK
jgi:hypothetical protein